MLKHVLIPLGLALWLGGAVTANTAGSQTDFNAALAAAEAANKQAGTLKNQWTTTIQAIDAAKQAAAAGDFDKAICLAKQAEALAKSSIFQANEQEEAWKAAVIH